MARLEQENRMRRAIGNGRRRGQQLVCAARLVQAICRSLNRRQRCQAIRIVRFGFQNLLAVRFSLRGLAAD
jgi:hypothetical protein